MDAQIDTFSTGNIDTPSAFHRLRRDLHDAAGPARLAEHRTLETIAELRERADQFRATLELYRGQGLGHWYAVLAARHDRLAESLADEATASGIIGGAS